MFAKKLAVCRGHEHPVVSVCVTHDGKIVSGSYINSTCMGYAGQRTCDMQRP